MSIVQITEEMLDAGRRAAEEYGQYYLRGRCNAEELAKEVYSAMRELEPEPALDGKHIAQIVNERMFELPHNYMVLADTKR